MADPNVSNQSSPPRRPADAENAQAVSRSEFQAERDSLDRAKDYTLRDRTRDIEENSMGNLHYGTPGPQGVGGGIGAEIGGGIALASVVVPESSIQFEPDAVLFQAAPQFDRSGVVDAQAAADIGLAPLAQRLTSASSDLNIAPASTLIAGDGETAGFSAENRPVMPDAGIENLNGLAASAQSDGTPAATPGGTADTAITGGPGIGEDPATDGYTDTDTDTPDVPVLQVVAVDVPENAAAGTQVGTISIDGAADGFSFAIQGAGAAYFEISGQDIVVRSGVDLDHEALARIPLEIVATGPDGTVLTDAVAIDVLDINEAPTALALSDTSVDENVPGGTVVAILTASDEDAGETFSYALSGADAGLFEIVGDELRVAAGASIDYETDDTFDLVVTVTDSGGNTFSRDVQITVNDILEASVGPVSDSDVAANTIAENAAAGSTVGVTALATDINVEDSVSYSVDDNRFTVDANGVVRVAAGASFDAETEGSIDIVITATSTDGSISQETFTIAVSDIDEFDVGAVTDSDGSANTIAENASIGTTVGVTALATDADVADTVNYSVDDNRFTVDANGVVKVAAGASFDAETEGSIDIVVTATSTDGSTSQETFTIAVSDVDESDVGAVTDTDGAANTIAENATAGTTVGVTALAADADVTDTVSYSFDDNRFAVDGNGVVTVASGASFDAETEGSIDIVVTATSTDGSTSQETFTIAVSDIDEFDVGAVTDSDGAANTIAENATVGTTVGVTALAADADITDTVSYSVDDNRFAVDANGVVTIASGASFDAETEGSIDIVVTATSTDGSTSQETFTIAVSDVDESDVGAVTDSDGSANTIAENATVGTTVGVTALAADADITDTVSYSVDDNRFTVDANGVVRVASGATFDAETEGSVDIVITATSTDGSTSQETFTIAVSDIDEFDVGAVTDSDGSANTIAENATVGTAVGVTALATDADVTDTVSYSVDDNRFTVDANGVVRVAAGASFDAETEGSIDIVVTATSTDGSTSNETFSIAVSDIDEFDVGAVTDTDGAANTIAENATAGTAVGVTALASDADVTDTVGYSVDDNRFTVDANGVVRVAAGASFDAETEGSIDIVVTATSTDGSTSQKTFTVAVSDIDEFDVGAVTDSDGAANTIAENASAGTTVGVTALATDADVTDTVGYSVDDNRFTVDANGVVRVVSGASFDAETEGSIDIVVTATSTDGSTSQETFTIAVSDIDESDVGAVTDTDGSANTIAENATVGMTVGVTALASDADITDTVGYSVDDNRFTVDANGVVRVAAGASFDAETEGSIDIVVTATSTDGSTSQETFTIAVSDIDEFDVGAVTDSDGSANTIAEDAVAGTTVGVTALASDADITDTVSYSVDDNRFTVDANGVVKVASGASFDYETETSIDIVVTATSTDGSTSQETFTIAVSDVDEAGVGSVTDTNVSANSIAENATAGDLVGITAFAEDGDGSDTVSYSIDDSRFTVDANGVVRVASGASFDAETEGSIDIVVTATSTDGSSSQETFSIGVSDVDEFDVGAVTDSNGSANTIAENATVGSTVGVTALATDADVTDDVSYSVDDNRFTVDANGVVRVASGASFDAETEGSIDIVVTATSDDGSTSQETFTISVSDIDEFDVGAVTDNDGSANSIAENATAGTTVGVTALATDADVTDSVSYTVDDNRFTVDGNGVVRVASGASFDAETEGSIDIVVTATSTDGSTSQETFTIAVSDIDEFDVGAVTDNDSNANTIAENATVGTTVGITALATDADVTDDVSYSVDDNRFTVDANGVVRVASGASFDAETEGSIDIVVTATSDDGSTSQETFTISVSDIDESDVGAVTDTDGTANTIAENATVGTTVGVTALATDADITDTVGYSVDDNRFTVDANGVVRVASGASFDAETEGSIDIVVTATSTDGSTSQETFTIAVSDVDEFDVGAVTDSDGSA
ncbi:MAG: cadherin domain-containing protein, partial [Pseudomonadota bacterium]